MKTRDPNIALVEIIAQHLGDMREDVVLVGGCATGLLITDTGRNIVRATTDVDLVIELTSRAAYYRTISALKKRGFREVPTHDPICRLSLGQLEVDVMPTDEEILGFANIWHSLAVRTSQSHTLPSGMQIRLITAPVFLASKIEAFYDRGDGDFQSSHDIEDIITVVDGRPELLDELSDADSALKDYLQDQLESFLETQEFVESINWHLPSDAANQNRTEVIIRRFREIAGI